MKRTIATLFIMLLCVIGCSSIDELRITPDVVYGHKMGMALTFDVFRPGNQNGAAVLFMNSGGFVSGKIRFLDMDDSQEYRYLSKDEILLLPEKLKIPLLAQFSVDELLKKGITVFDVRHGSSPCFKLGEMVTDCRQAVAFIRKHAERFNIDPDRVGLFGASAGGYLAAYLAVTEPGIRTAVVYYPAGYDFIRLKQKSPEVYPHLPALHLDEDMLKKLSIKPYLSANDPSVLIIYGKEDAPFITSSCGDIAKDLKAAGVEVEICEFPDVGHEFRNKDGYQVERGETARLKMAEWFSRHLKKK